MAKQLDPRLQEILAKYHPNPRTAIWDCHGTWVAKHKDVEIMAAAAKITFSQPEIIEANSERKTATILVTGRMGDVSEWSIGEASPANNKNAYPFAMAEKRAKDRVALKLLGLHGFIYAEDEADDFKAGGNDDQEPTVDRTKLDMLIAVLKTVENKADMDDFKRKNKEIIDGLSVEETTEFVKAHKDHVAALKAGAQKQAA